MEKVKRYSQLIIQQMALSIYHKGRETRQDHHTDGTSHCHEECDACKSEGPLSSPLQQMFIEHLGCANIMQSIENVSGDQKAQAWRLNDLRERGEIRIIRELLEWQGGGCHEGNSREGSVGSVDLCFPGRGVWRDHTHPTGAGKDGGAWGCCLWYPPCHVYPGMLPPP